MFADPLVFSKVCKARGSIQRNINKIKYARVQNPGTKHSLASRFPEMSELAKGLQTGGKYNKIMIHERRVI